MSLTDLKYLRENAVEAGRLIDIADRRLYDIFVARLKRAYQAFLKELRGAR